MKKPTKREMAGVALGLAIGAGGSTTMAPDEGAIRQVEADNARVFACQRYAKGEDKLECLQALKKD